MAALLERDDIDAVYISLPPSLHGEWAARALHAGKHVLVEKPIATTAAEARAVVTLAEDRDLVLRENFMFLHHPQHDAVAALMAEGRLGGLRSFRGAFCFPPLPTQDIRYVPGLGGGALLDAGVYPLRAAAMLLGPGLRVAGATARVRQSDGLDLSGQALLVSPSGVLASVEFGFEHAYGSSYSLWGDGAKLTVGRAFTPCGRVPAGAGAGGTGPCREIHAPGGGPAEAVARRVRRGRGRRWRCGLAPGGPVAAGRGRHDGTGRCGPRAGRAGDRRGVTDRAGAPR